MSFSRRRFLMLSAGAGASLAAGGLGLHSWLAKEPRNESHVTRQSWALGADVSMTVMGLPEKHARQALDAAFAELELVEQVMSLYRPESQLCRLNRDRVVEQPHPYLIEVLLTAEQTSRLSNGAFDITVQPLWNLFATHHKQDTSPTEEEIAAVCKFVDWRGVECSVERLRLKSPVQAITLNGIAQGFAADRALAALRAHGVQHALINTGELCSLGAKPDGQPWTVGIQHPRISEAFISLAALTGRSLATSGDYETTFSADFATNHIFDPRTGQSPEDLSSVSIAAPTAMQADALSTAAMVLGADRTLDLAARLPNVDALLVTKDGQVLQTAGFPVDSGMQRLDSASDRSKT